MRHLITMLLFVIAFSCGKQTHTVEVRDSQQTVEGEVRIVIDWNLEAFDAVFRDGCELLEETPEAVELCIAEKIENLLILLNGVELNETI
tara:strand:+ start:497 stop:766 length:270 start_codon:yes stop_codon:yes gene_type:complete